MPRYRAASGVLSRGPNDGLDSDLLMLLSDTAGSVNQLPDQDGNMQRPDCSVEWGNLSFYRQRSPTPLELNVQLISNNIRPHRGQTVCRLGE